ncbi:hypothetical protein C2E20_4611 [Micractinium conductrix]|uniref:Uncharacterized protein n=1 Tax=Micractinium conductrix TaxID=554055 RepID=A0A2P6VDE6_9CHLO|nr:hypothetical protein C2E20_4611 [Micractinium conductrix]|eukprot:PSC72081.1 hypothetical protein C2E20_4611 [Micractinium conductrix]
MKAATIMALALAAALACGAVAQDPQASPSLADLGASLTPGDVVGNPLGLVPVRGAVAAAATVNACRWCHLPSLLPPGAAALLLTRLPQLPADDHHVAVPLLRSQHNAEVSLDADNLWTFEFDGYNVENVGVATCTTSRSAQPAPPHFTLPAPSRQDPAWPTIYTLFSSVSSPDYAPIQFGEFNKTDLDAIAQGMMLPDGTELGYIDIYDAVNDTAICVVVRMAADPTQAIFGIFGNDQSESELVGGIGMEVDDVTDIPLTEEEIANLPDPDSLIGPESPAPARKLFSRMHPMLGGSMAKPIALASKAQVTQMGDSSLFADSQLGTCNDPANFASPSMGDGGDVVRTGFYKWTAPFAGFLTAYVCSNDFLASLVVLGNGVDADGKRIVLGNLGCGGVYRSCTDRNLNDPDSQLIIKVKKGQAYIFAVTGVDVGDFGAFKLNLNLEKSGSSMAIAEFIGAKAKMTVSGNNKGNPTTFAAKCGTSKSDGPDMACGTGFGATVTIMAEATVEGGKATAVGCGTCAKPAAVKGVQAGSFYYLVVSGIQKADAGAFKLSVETKKARKPLETSPPMWALVATAAAGLNAGHGLASLMDHNVMMDVGTDHYSAAFPKMSTATATACSTLSAVATGASLAAYFAENEAKRDPAFLTAAVLAGLPIIYSMLVLGPAKVVLENKGLTTTERSSYFSAWGVKKAG